MGKTLTEQQIVGVIRKILRQHDEGAWICADFLFAQVLAHPGRYGVENGFCMPQLDKWRRVCKVMFETRGGGKELEVKVSWKPR
jgi:hypothetical protein